MNMDNIMRRLPDPRRARLKRKPKKLGEWREVVAKSLFNSESVADREELEKGSHLWKVQALLLDEKCESGL